MVDLGPAGSQQHSSLVKNRLSQARRLLLFANGRRLTHLHEQDVSERIFPVSNLPLILNLPLLFIGHKSLSSIQRNTNKSR